LLTLMLQTLTNDRTHDLKLRIKTGEAQQTKRKH
jgi:hypothetical protein